MRGTLETIGIFVIATIGIAIPILATVSFFLGWYASLSFILIVLTLFVWGFIAYSIAEMEDKE